MADSNEICSNVLLDRFSKHISGQIWRINGLMLFNSILMGLVVVVGAYAPKYRYHPFISFVFLGATTLFLPIVSEVAATADSQYFSGTLYGFEMVTSMCQPRIHIILILVWTGLVLIIGINTSTIVAADSREGRNVGFPRDLLIKAIWTAYLVLSTASNETFVLLTRKYFRTWLSEKDTIMQLIFVPLYALIVSKLALRYCAFRTAQGSVSFGRNPRLIAGHMAQLGESHNAEQVDDYVSPPALVVNGEGTAKVETQSHGYRFTSLDSCKKVVTIDTIWRIDDTLVRSEAKDMCLSFAFFKLLRCRFAKCTASEAGFMKARKFFHDTYIKGYEYERVFRVIADELSFIHDYYYSCLPISYSRPFLPFMNIILSLCSIGYCSFIFLFISRAYNKWRVPGENGQIQCVLMCPTLQSRTFGNGMEQLDFGSRYFDMVPAYLVLAVLMLSEVRDIVFYACSNWTKVALICNCIKYSSWRESPVVRKFIAFVFKYCRSKLMNNWEDKMSQCSVIAVLQPRCLLPWFYQRKVNVSNAVKYAIFEALKGQTNRQDESLKGILPPSSPLSGFNIAMNGNNDAEINGKAQIILVWHVATSIFQARHPLPPQSDPNETAATQLSRYCAYLVASRPELIPAAGDSEWCKSLYQAAKKDADRILAAGRPRPALSTATPEADYRLLVELLRADSNHEVLKKGAALGQKLVESNTGWKALADFWSRTILYLAPSESLDGHAEAIARGGELITLLWAMLAHDGVVTRYGSDAAASSDASGGDHV